MNKDSSEYLPVPGNAWERTRLRSSERAPISAAPLSCRPGRLLGHCPLDVDPNRAFPPSSMKLWPMPQSPGEVQQYEISEWPIQVGSFWISGRQPSIPYRLAVNSVPQNWSEVRGEDVLAVMDRSMESIQHLAESHRFQALNADRTQAPVAFPNRQLHLSRRCDCLRTQRRWQGSARGCSIQPTLKPLSVTKIHE